MSRRYVRMVVEMIAEVPWDGPSGTSYVIKNDITEFLNEHHILQAGEVKVEVDVLGPVEIIERDGVRYARPWVERKQ